LIHRQVVSANGIGMLLMLLCPFAEFAGAFQDPTAQVDQEKPAEIWYGVLDAESRKFRFAIELFQNDDQWTGKLTSLDEAGRQFSLDNLSRTSAGLDFEIKTSKGKYSGQLSDDGNQITGNWKQSGEELKLDFDKVETIPQEKLSSLWTGRLNVGFQKLDLAVRVLESGEVLLDSTTQKAGGFVAEMETIDDQVTISVGSLNAKFTGKYNVEKTEIVGKWKQGFLTLDLTLAKSDKIEPVVERKRPQRPQAPFPYEIQQVKFKNEKADIELAGTLTLPDGSDKPPVVVLISGSGPQDRDETLLEHKPFWVIADYFARRGIAVLRYDDRGTGESTGDFAAATTAEFADDAEAAVQFLKAIDRVNSKQIGLCGHSEGGLIAPIVAARNQDVAFIILMAGPGVNGEQISYSQLRLMLEVEQVEEQKIEQHIKMQRAIIRNVLEHPEMPQQELREKIITEIEPILDPDDKEAEAREAFSAKIEAGMQQLNSPWFRYFLKFEPTSSLEKVTCPVLAINGAKDLQVDAELNLPMIETALQKAGNQDFKLISIPELNHLFQRCQTGSVSEYVEIEETFDPATLELMADWILERTR
jgi:pimeloyl-ACP methyl ester carboxylesterase